MSNTTLRISKDAAKMVKNLSKRRGVSQTEWLNKAVYFLNKTGFDIFNFDKTKKQSVEDRIISFMKKREKDFFLPMTDFFNENVKMQTLVLKGLENFGIIDLMNKKENISNENKLIDPLKNSSILLEEIADKIEEKQVDKTAEISTINQEELLLKIARLENENKIYKDELNYLLNSIKSGGALSGAKFIINIVPNDIKRIKKVDNINMYIKIHKPTDYANNKSGSGNAIDYLEKENLDKSFTEQERFFNQWSDNISKEKAEYMLDANKGRLGKNDTKFYMLSVSPNKKELEHIGKDNQKFKKYINNLMDEYAKNFNRNYPNGESLRGTDLVYFAKIENERTYKYTNVNDKKIIDKNNQIRKEIKNLKTVLGTTNKQLKEKEIEYLKTNTGKIIKEGVQKDGDQRHVHILVHRYDADQKFKLSPLSNARNTKNKEVGKSGERKKIQAGFDREKFIKKGEELFDKDLSYNRNVEETYAFKKNKTIPLMALTDPIKYAEVVLKTEIKKAIINSIQDKSTRKALGYVTTKPEKIPRKVINKLENKAVENIAKIIGQTANITPPTAAIKAVKDAVVFIGKQISKGAGI